MLEKIQEKYNSILKSVGDDEAKQNNLLDALNAVEAYILEPEKPAIIGGRPNDR